MPYSSNRELPSSVKGAYSERCQDVFRKAFNADLSKNKNESRAFQVGHTAAKNCMKHT